MNEEKEFEGIITLGTIDTDAKVGYQPLNVPTTKLQEIVNRFPMGHVADPAISANDKEVEIKNPCSESWDLMKDTDKGKFCDKCNKDVYDISLLTRSETRELVRKNGGICILRRCDNFGHPVFKREE